MRSQFVLVLIAGVFLFGVGALTRRHMNIVIGRSPAARGSATRSTEIRYARLVAQRGAGIWPLIVTVVCIPVGVLLAFGAVIMNNRFVAR